MENKKIIIALLGIFFLISCGPKRYGCNPNRRCEIKHNAAKPQIFNKTENKSIQNS